MSLLPNVTYGNANTPIFLLANVSTLNVNSISTNLIQANVISTNVVNSVSSFANYISAADVELSSIYATVVDLDGQVLTANPTELLLNGVPLATTANLSSLQDWALDPAISSINVNGFDILNANNAYSSNVSTTNVRAQTVFTNNLFANNIFAFSTYTSTISSLAEVADFAYIDHLSSGNAFLGSLSTLTANASTLSGDSAFFTTLSSVALNVSSINGQTTTDQILSSLTIAPGQFIELQNFGESFASVGSAQLRHDWFYQASTSTDVFYDTNISSVRYMTQTPGGYTDNPPSRLHCPQIGASTILVSSINGSEFTPTGITVQVAGVSSLVANSISSIGAEIRQALLSTIVFSPSLNPSLGGVNVNLGLGGILGNVIGWGAGVFGAAAGTVGLVTGMTALATGRQTQYINQGNFELVNTQTQLQISTLGTAFSTIYRYVSSINPEQVPGEEIFISTIHPGGGLAIRSFSDPMATLSSPTSTIQSFGQWVSLADTLDVADWALYPAVSTIRGDQAQISSMQVSSIGTETMNVSSLTAYTIAANSADITTTLNAFQINSDYASTGISQIETLYNNNISTAIIYGANSNLFGIGVPGLEIQAANIWISSPQTNIAGLINSSTITANLHTGKAVNVSTVQASTITLAQSGAFGLSTLMYVSTAQIPGTGTSTCMYVNTDLSLIQNDLYCQQLRVGYANNGGSGLTEIAMYAPTVGGTVIGLNVGNNDRTARIQSTLNSGFGGYILDTQLNPPIFSTINASTAVMAYFPSTTAASIGISTIGFIPPIQYVGSWYSSTSQTVAGANTQTPLTFNSQAINIGGFSYSGSTITVPIAGTYEISHSVQFATSSGGTNKAQFYPLKNGAPIAQTNSIVSIVNNGDTLGNISIIDTAAANDKYGIAIYSADANMTATATPAGATPAVPSIITNIKRL